MVHRFSASPLSPQAALAQEADPQGDLPSGEKKLQVITVPQRLYGVAKNAPAFKINAKAKTALTFESSNPDVAEVAPDGTVTVGDRTGMAVISITAAETEEYRAAKTKVAVRVAAYVKTNKMIAQSSQNRDGHPGDSGDNESIYCSYFDLGWGFIVRCTDPYIADKAATVAKLIVENPHFGYNTRKPKSQFNVDRRASIYEAVHEVLGNNPAQEDLEKISDIEEYADTSCSPTLLAGYWLYYDMDTQLSLKWIPPYDTREFLYYCGAVNVEYHQLETAIRQVNREYERAGKLAPFKIIYIPKSLQESFFSKANAKKNLKRGDIICRCPNFRGGGHTAMVQ